MLQDIGSPRGIAHAMANKYWPTICSKLVVAAAELTADFAEGDIVIGEYAFSDGSLLNWAVNAHDSATRLSILFEFTSADGGGGLSSRTILTVDESTGEIDKDRTNADESSMQAPSMQTLNANIRTAECFQQLLTVEASTIVNRVNSYTLKAGVITKG